MTSGVKREKEINAYVYIDLCTYADINIYNKNLEKKFKALT